jgi:signal peptidase I
MNLATKLLLGASILGTVVILGLIGCRIAGLLIPYQVPGGSMAPTIQPGDCVIMEGFSYRFGVLQRGDLIVFSTDGIKQFPKPTVFVKRFAGQPGETLAIREGNLLVNGSPVVLRNAAGPITYIGDLHPFPKNLAEPIVVPPNSYFVLGDNSANSFDSRYWGAVSAKNIRGRVWFRYWPLSRLGLVE